MIDFGPGVIFNWFFKLRKLTFRTSLRGRAFLILPEFLSLEHWYHQLYPLLGSKDIYFSLAQAHGLGVILLVKNLRIPKKLACSCLGLAVKYVRLTIICLGSVMYAP